MHPSVLSWVETKVTELQLAGRSTLDVGSLDVNGSPRPLFTGAYVGVDQRDGPGVDRIASAAALPFPDATFGVVVCTEMLEHDPAPWRSLPEMGRVLQPGGWLLVTCRGIGFPHHDYPHDFWRFTRDGVRRLLDLADVTAVEVIDDTDPTAPGVFALAHKPA